MRQSANIMLGDNAKLLEKTRYMKGNNANITTTFGARTNNRWKFYHQRYRPDGTSYKLDYHGYEGAPSTASQTAWALIGLMAAGATRHPAVARGIDFLLRMQGPDGLWLEERHTATGFQRVFFLRYHGYAKFFPLWALARYKNLMEGRSIKFGM